MLISNFNGYVFSQKINKRTINSNSNIIVGFSKDFTENQKRFITKYEPNKNFEISFKECKLIGIEIDLLSNINYYIFEDKSKIVFTVFEYNSLNNLKGDSVYNLSSHLINNELFDIDVILPKWVKLKELNSTDNYYIENNFYNKYSLSHRELISLPSFLMLSNINNRQPTGFDKQTEINADTKKSKKNIRCKDTTFVMNKIDTLIERKNFQLISIEVVSNSNLLLYTFNDLSDKTKFIYVFDYIESRTTINTLYINDLGSRFDLVLSPIYSLNVNCVNHQLSKNRYQLITGRFVGGGHYSTYILDNIAYSR